MQISMLAAADNSSEMSDPAVTGMTLYVNSSDWALWASEKLSSKGRCGAEARVFEGAETIDTTGIKPEPGQRAAVLEIGRDARAAKAVVADLRCYAGRLGASAPQGGLGANLLSHKNWTCCEV